MKNSTFKILGLFGLSLLASTTLANATSGSFALGYGASQRAAGGAGVAHAMDAMSAALNPALAADVGNEFQMGVEFFSPDRGYTGDGTFFVPRREFRSGEELFFIPNISINRRIDDNSAWNFSFYGNGGMNTTYESATGAAPTGVYRGGDAGVDLIQAFASLSYARRDGNFSWGIAPTLAIQAFKAQGLGQFASLSVDANNLTSDEYDFSIGGGIRGGFTFDISDQVRFGVSGHTKMYMSKLDKYAGLFEDHGSFDIPASVTVGLAVDTTPDLTLMFDYQHIFYDGVKAISNGFNGAPLGSTGGPGFGWDNVDVFKIGAEWRQNERMTWRAGYAHASNPVGSEDVTLGILAPGVVEHHFTAGGTYQVNPANAIDFAIVYSPSNTVKGTEVTPMGPTPGTIELEMHQISATIGWKHTF